MKRGTRIAWTAAAIVVVLLGLNYWHQATHFNKHVTVNGVAVGGMNAQQAYHKLSSTKISNDVYLNGQKIYSGKTTDPGFTSADQSKVKAALKKQVTFFPSKQKRELTVTPSNADTQAAKEMRSAVNEKIAVLNETRKKPVDAKVTWQNNHVNVIEPKKGNYYDQKRLAKYLRNHQYDVVMHLPTYYLQPLGPGSSTIKREQKKLQALNNAKITYQVEDKQYKFNADQVITKATYNGSYHYDTSKVNSQIKKINEKQATLGKAFKFRTHAGKEIKTATDGSYGWKINAHKAGQTLAQGLVDGKSKVDAKTDLEGLGYTAHGLGYGVKKNDGLGDTYVEVSIEQQHAWFYKNGKEVFSANIVSGKHSDGEDTPKGVWYFLYQQKNATLGGTSKNGRPYASPVKYWSPFTDSGDGFHDASWRTNWSSRAYLTDGSNGCCNMHPGDAGPAFEAMETHEPVIIY